MKWLLLIELLTAMAAGAACLHYWRFPSPQRQRMTAILLVVCILSAGFTVYQGDSRPPGLTPEQKELTWRVLDKEFRLAGSYVGEHYAGARVLLLLPAQTDCSPDPARMRAAFMKGAGTRVTSLDMEIFEASGLDYTFDDGLSPEDIQTARSLAGQLLDLLDKYPQTTVVVDESGVCMQVPPAYMELHWQDDPRPRLIEGISNMLEDVEPFIKASWLDAALVVIDIDADAASGPVESPPDMCFVRADTLEEVRAKIDAQVDSDSDDASDSEPVSLPEPPPAAPVHADVQVP